MYISRLMIENFKCFDQAGPVEFGPGINVVCGQNNAGKSALLEALSCGFASNPHRSLRTLQTPTAPLGLTSHVDLTFSLGRNELFQLLRRSGTERFFIPSPNYSPEEIRRKWGQIDNPTFIQRFLEESLSPPTIELSVRFIVSGGERRWVAARMPSFSTYPAHVAHAAPGQIIPCIEFALKADTAIVRQDSVMANASTEIGVVAAAQLHGAIYRFRPERYNVGECPTGHNNVLAPDASNLPEVLGVMQSNHERFRRFNREVSSIFPQVTWISVRPKATQRSEIVVWQIDPSTERDDLAVPLSECGTGLGQVLAILCVLLSRSEPGVILIDEPQSFLHPGAVRKLIEVIRDHPEHQVILATHSPTVLACAEPATVTMVRIEAGVTSLRPVSHADATDLRALLAEVGARLSDVFGADRVLWVEGPTEEHCVPLVLERVAKKRLSGTAVLGVRRTGELQGRDAEKIFEVYRRLSGGATLMPPAVAFVFDRECRTRDQMDDMRRNSRGLIFFLPRRMFENYLLHSGAIAAVCGSIERFRETPVTEEEVSVLLDLKRQDASYFCNRAVPPTQWLEEVDGGRLLADLFATLSENRVSYDKVKHGEALTRWLVGYAPGHMSELAEFLGRLLDGPDQVTRG